jgi:hypothetical protein
MTGGSDYRFSGGGGRSLQQKGDNLVWICVVGGIVLIFGMFLLGPNKHRTHSAGDYGVPTMANGGCYKDGTRQMTMNRANDRAYGGHGGKVFGNTFLLAAGLVAAWLVWCLFLPRDDHSCNGACCPIGPSGSC